MSNRPLNLNEYEALAVERLDPLAYDYYRSGAADQICLGRNRAAFDEIQLLPRVLVDVSSIDHGCEILGQSSAMPVAVAPTAFHRLADPEGECATARAAAVDEYPLLPLHPFHDHDRAGRSTAEGPRWFQLYVFRDRGITADLLARAEANGYSAILLTVDAPVLGRREADIRNEFALPEGFTIASVPDGRVEAPGMDRAWPPTSPTSLIPSLSWDDLEWLVTQTSLPVVVKGVHRPDDAERAVESGAAGVAVSNHGGRQLDAVPASIEMLPAIADAVGGRSTILLDGGVRRGTDIVKALALGADCVMLGRPILWALATDGEAGVRHALGLIAAELANAMALCGAPTLADVTPDLLA